MNMMSVREYLHQEHKARLKRLATPPRPIRETKGRQLYAEAIGPALPIELPIVNPILTLEESNIPAPVRNGVSLHMIQQAVADHFKISWKDLTSARRTRTIVMARFAYYFLARHNTTRSLVFIGKRCNGKDHTTVMHGIAEINRQWELYVDHLNAIQASIDPKVKWGDSPP